MVFDSVWKNKKEAENFIDQQPGVMGRRQKWSQDKYGDWEIRTEELQ